MRVRALDANGDMTFGDSAANFLVDSPQCVLQCVLTALRLHQGEWFLDITAGMPWESKVLGFGTQSFYDNAVKTCIRGVQDVTGITNYSSSFNSVTRHLTIGATIQTAFGPANLLTSLQFAAPPTGGYGVGGYDVRPYGE